MHSKSVFKPSHYLLPVALLSLPILAAHAQSLQTARQGIIASLAARDQAYDSRSLVPFLQTYSPGWTFTNVSGRDSNYRAYSADIARLFAASPSGVNGHMSSRLVSLRINQHGAEAIVMSRWQRPTKSSKSGEWFYYRSYTNDSIWQPSSNGWQEQSDRLLLDRITNSVKPMLSDVATPPPTTHAVSNPTAYRDITAALNERSASYRHGDLAGYLQCFSPAFVMTSVAGKRETYKDIKAAIVSAFGKYPTGVGLGTNYKVISVSLSGPDVEAIVQAHYAYPVKHTHTGSIYAYRDSISSGLWTRVGNLWQENSDRFLCEQMTYSSKPISP